jgi:4-amino-4-deoxy-L-arabinose transferase-like glycosyltransferase
VSRTEWLFFGVLILCYAFFLEPAGTNTISRYDMVWALAHGTARIDAFHTNTIDISVYNGHYYSPRSLGLSLLAVPVFDVVQLIMNNPPVTNATMNIAIPIVNLFTVVPIAIITTIVFYRFVLRLRPELSGTPAPFVVTTAFALGTLEYPFAVSFFSHAMGGGLMLIGFYCLYRARSSSAPERLVLLAGLLVGYAVITEYPTGIIMLALCGYILAVFPERRLRMLILFGAAMLPSVLLLGWYDWFAFGSPFHLSYDSVSCNSVNTAQFCGQHTGFFGITFPQPGGLVQILAWPRGLLVESPFLIFVVVGFVRWWRDSVRPSAEMLVCLAVAVVYPLVISSYYLPMAGENLPGPRLLVPMLPFACLALAWAVDERNDVVRGIFAGLLALGVLLSALYVVTGVREYHTMSTYPVFKLYLPVLATGYIPNRVGNGPTPLNLTSYYLGVSQAVSLYLLLMVLAIWTIYICMSLIYWRPAPASSDE